MAHFAKLSEDNTVLQVEVIADADAPTEEAGIAFCQNLFGWSLWKQTSYNTREGIYYNSDGTEGDQSKAFRGNFPSPGYIWDEDSNTFWPPKPDASWVKNHTTKEWDAPISHPLVINEGSGESLVAYNIYWDEDAYQANNTKGWKMTKSNDTSDPKTVYDWNGSSLIEE